MAAAAVGRVIPGENLKIMSLEEIQAERPQAPVGWGDKKSLFDVLWLAPVVDAVKGIYMPIF